jgi:FecR protein
MLRHNLMSQNPMNRGRLRKAGLLLSMIFALVFSLAPLSHAQDVNDEDGHDSQARIVRISYVEGDVRLDNGHGYESATMNVPLTEGNWLQTGHDGWAEVQLEDGSLIRLAPDSVIAFTQLARASSGATLTTVDLDQGEAEFKVTKHDDGDFNVTVKKNTIALTRSGSFRVTSTNANPLEVVVLKGEVGVGDTENGGEVAVKKGETFVLDPNDPARYALDKGVDTDDLDQWSTQRDDALSTYASAGQGYAQSPYQYGASDLNYYGQYYDVPGYGEVWQPNNVGYNWDPFSNGYWSYSPGFGYTWVSSYPWGWMPYRYGRWVFVNGRGWFWAPGGWNRWYSRPRLVNVPPGFHAPIPPADRRIVDRNPDRNHHEPPPAVGGPVRRSTGPVGGRVGDGDEHALGRSGGDRGNKRTYTNDDIARVPRTDNPPPQPKPDVNNDHGRVDGDRNPKVVDQQPARGTGDRGGDFDRSRDNHQPTPEPVRRSNNEDTPPPTRTERQHNNPPAQTFTPAPQRQPEHNMYTPPPQPAPVHQQPAPPPPPVVHQSAPPPAPVVHQSAPPPESHVRSSDDGSHGRPK